MHETNIKPIRSTTQIWVVTRHQYGISVVVSQTSFLGETSGGVAKCRLFSQANLFEEEKEGGTQSFRRAVGPLLLAVYNTVVFKFRPHGFFLPFSAGKALQTRCVVSTLLKATGKKSKS